MKTRLLFTIFVLAIFSLSAQTTHNITWGFNSNPTAMGDLNSSRTIEVGDTVIWTWDTTGSHNVVSQVGSAQSFNSGGTVAAPNTFSVTFNVEGTNDYVCNPHSTFMFGTITVEQPLGLDEFGLNGFDISPNPSKDRLNIELPSGIDLAQLQVFDVLGKQILNREISGMETSVNVSNWNNGIYVVRVISGDRSQTKRFVKQ